MLRGLLWAASLSLLLAACAAPKKPAPTTAGAGAPAAPKGVKIGRPYTVFGVTYVPVDDREYDEVGIASWYGPTFHAKPTANGEIYDQEALTAAHKTLPMPSWVEVENLDNGRKLVVRINDRGPFVDGRIIDLSRRSAEILGVERAGLARVRVTRVFPEGDWARNAPVLAASPAPARPRPPASAAPVIASAAVAPPARPAPASIAPAPAGAPGGPFIQVAALSDEGRARALASVLGDYGPAFAAPTGTGLWRVRIGPLDPARAADLLEEVRAAGYADARVMR